MNEKLQSVIKSYVRAQTTEHNMYKVSYNESDEEFKRLEETPGGEVTEETYHCYKCGKFEAYYPIDMVNHIKEHITNGDI